MNRWKWLVILLGIISIGIVIASSFSFWPGLAWNPAAHRELQNMPASPVFPLLEQHMQAISSISVLISLGIIGILVLFVLPARVRGVVGQVPASFRQLLQLTLLGFLVIILVLAVSLISVLAIGTFPLAILLSALLFVAGLVGFVSLAFAFGRGLLKRAGWNRAPLYAYLFGLLLLYALTRIPWIGPFLFLGSASLGLGATIASNFGSGQPWSLNSLVEEK